jgi:hypothetical protein
MRNVLFDDLYRNFIGNNLEKYGSGHAQNASLTTTGHPCFGAVASAEMNAEYATAPATTATVTTPAPPYQFGVCSETCNDFTGRLYTYMKDQLPHSGNHTLLRNIQYIYAGLLALFVLSLMSFAYIEREEMKIPCCGGTLSKPKGFVIFILLAIIVIAFLQMMTLEKFRGEMKSDDNRFGISIQITTLLVAVVPLVGCPFVSHDDMKSLMDMGRLL